jgi:hypothetical protein
MTPSFELVSTLNRISRLALTIAVAAGAICVVGYVRLPERFYPAYLTAFVYWLGIALGCLVIALIHGLTGGAWGKTIRRVVEAGYETLPLLAVLFAPLWFGVAFIYEWADLEFVRRHESLVRKAGYLNVVGFQLRTIVYFAIWIGITWALNRSSPNEERIADTPRSRRLQLTSGLSLIAYGFTVTLSSVDWIMSLEPQWYSTMYGLIIIAGQAVSGLSFAVIVVAALGTFEPWSQIVTPGRLNDLGNLLLAAVMFWAYCSFFQYLVIWSGNLPEENVWYVHRSQRGWQYVALGLMTLHFAVPFLLLLSRRLKRQRTSLWRVAVLLLIMRYVDLYWLAVPGFQRSGTENQGLTVHGLDLVALAAIGGAWLSVFAWRLSVRIQLPMYDPVLKEAVDERSKQAAVA